MAISDELNRIIQAKAGIRSALEEKGLTIGDSSTLDEYPGLIQEMETGGGSSQDTSVLIDLIQRNITSIDIPYGITQIGDHAFRGCTNLIDVSIPNTVDHIYNSAFEGSGLRSINLPPSVRFLGGSCLKNTKIQHLYIPNTISQPYGNFNTAVDVFSYNSSLISVTFQEPADFTQIPQGMCYYCPELRTVNIPQTITKIWSDAFRKCYELSKIVIPESVIEIGNNAFYDVSFGMSMAMLPTTPPTLSQTGNNIFGGSGYNWPIYVKNTAVDTYKNAGGNWDNVSTRIQPLAAMDYDSSTMTVTASGRDNVELYVDSSLIDSSVYTFTPGTADASHVITVKSVDPSLGVLDEVSQEILIEGEEIDYSTQYFGLTAVQNASVGLTGQNTVDMKYSSDGENWTQWDYANETLNLPAGETLYFKGDNSTGFSTSTTSGMYNSFVLKTGRVKAHGNVQSLLYDDNFVNNNTIPNISCFANLFFNCSALTTAPVLPATTLTNYCYSNMFERCTSLITAPVLPATTLTNYCYQAMFANCTSLTTTPVLPATRVPLGGYYRMFENCTSLITAPELPATSFGQSAYGSMFEGCTSLTTPPSILPASTNTDKFVYDAMFKDCTSLTTAPVISQITYKQNIFGSMFEGCTSLNYIKYIGTSPLTSLYHTDWVKNVSSTGTFVMNADATWDPEEYRGTSGIPEGWTVEKVTA